MGAVMTKALGYIYLLYRNVPGISRAGTLLIFDAENYA